jgi:Flp pilus assembly protein TadG
MKMLRMFMADRSAASAAEFALVLPIFALFFVGIIDVGLYSWSINRAEKATQIGARYAVVTEMVPAGLTSFSFATSGSPIIPQGTPVPQSSFPDIVCSGTTTISCAGNASFTAANQQAFTNIVGRMNQIDSRIENQNVWVTYSWSGLGFSGDPNGPDVAPIVTVEIRNLQYSPLSGVIFGATVNVRDLSYSLTSEDGSGDYSN